MAERYWLDVVDDQLRDLNDYAAEILDATVPAPPDGMPPAGAWIRGIEIDRDFRVRPSSPWHQVSGGCLTHIGRWESCSSLAGRRRSCGVSSTTSTPTPPAAVAGRTNGRLRDRPGRTTGVRDLWTLLTGPED
jgi:hypothetical protein